MDVRDNDPSEGRTSRGEERNTQPCSGDSSIAYIMSICLPLYTPSTKSYCLILWFDCFLLPAMFSSWPTCRVNLFSDCGEDITLEANQAYRLTSPGYPEPYDDNVMCIWIIRMPLGRRMRILFEHFELEDQLVCSIIFLNLNLLLLWFYDTTRSIPFSRWWRTFTMVLGWHFNVSCCIVKYGLLWAGDFGTKQTNSAPSVTFPCFLEDGRKQWGLNFQSQRMFHFCDICCRSVKEKVEGHVT